MENKSKNKYKFQAAKKMKMYLERSVSFRYVTASKTQFQRYSIIPGVNTVTIHIQFHIYALRKCRINIYML